MFTIRPRVLRRSGKKRLRHGDLPYHIDLQLPTQLIQGQYLQGTGNDNAGVVYQSGQSGVTHRSTYRIRRGGDLGRVRYVQRQRHDTVCAKLLHLAFRAFANTGEDAKATPRKFPGAGGADTRRGPGNHHRGPAVQ